MLAPPCPHAQTGMYGSGVPRDSPLEGHLPWDFALITPGKARSSVFNFNLFYGWLRTQRCILASPPPCSSLRRLEHMHVENVRIFPAGHTTFQSICRSATCCARSYVSMLVQDPSYDLYGYAKVATRTASSIGGAAAACPANVQAFFKTILSLGETPSGRQQINDGMSLCANSTLDSPSDVLALAQYVQSSWYLAVSLLQCCAASVSASFKCNVGIGHWLAQNAEASKAW